VICPLPQDVPQQRTGAALPQQTDGRLKLPIAIGAIPGLILGAALPAVLAFSQQRRPIRFAGCVAALLVSGSLVQSPFGHAVFAERTFFGVYRVRVDDRLNYRFMFHGPTLHGMQSSLEARRAASLSYFHEDGPIGQVFKAVPVASSTPEVGVVGLGVGSLASYVGPAQRWVFY